MKNTARIFKALSDETRLRIIGLLQTGGELCVCDLIAALDLPQSTVSRHLAYLRNSGLVDDRRKGAWMYYRILDSGAFINQILFSLSEVFRTSRNAAADREALATYRATKAPDTCDI